MVGSAIEKQAEAARGEAATTAEADAALASRMQDHPYLAGATARQGELDPDAVFRRGLDLLIAGLRARQAALPAGDEARGAQGPSSPQH